MFRVVSCCFVSRQTGYLAARVGTCRVFVRVMRFCVMPVEPCRLRHEPTGTGTEHPCDMQPTRPLARPATARCSYPGHSRCQCGTPATPCQESSRSFRPGSGRICQRRADLVTLHMLRLPEFPDFRGPTLSRNLVELGERRTCNVPANLTAARQPPMNLKFKLNAPGWGWPVVKINSCTTSGRKYSPKRFLSRWEHPLQNPSPSPSRIRTLGDGVG
jgi:hypothetical protein